MSGKKTRRGSRGGRGRKIREETREARGEMPSKAQIIKMLSSWDAARRSERRGSVVLPRRDPKKRVSPTERTDILGKVEAGEQNVGFVKRATEGTARLIGHQKPQANTGNANFDDEIEGRFAAMSSHPQAFDMSGNFDFLEWQTWVRESKIRAGDCLTVLAEGAEGGARYLCYEAGQVGDGYGSGMSDASKPKNLYDGVFLDKWGGRAGFRILDGDGRPASTVPRERAIYHSFGKRVGRVRQVSGLAHAVANFLDMVEILADTKHAVKIAALWAAWLEDSGSGEGDEDMGEDLMAFLKHAEETAEVFEDMGGESVGGDEMELPAPEPEAPGDILTVDDMVQGGRFQSFGKGKKLNTTNDTRPSPNVMGMLSWLVRDMCWGVGVAPEVIWDPSKLGGPAMRFVMAETGRFIEDQHNINRRDCQKIWMYSGAKEAKIGRLKIPAELKKCWYKTKWIAQADLTIDRGRDGKLELERMKQKRMSRAEYWGSRGKDWKEQEQSIIDEDAWVEKQGGVS